jgi:hypothetical protein
MECSWQFFACSLILGAYRLYLAHVFEDQKRFVAAAQLTPELLLRMHKMRNSYSYPRLMLYFLVLFFIVFLGWGTALVLPCTDDGIIVDLSSGKIALCFRSAGLTPLFLLQRSRQWSIVVIFLSRGACCAAGKTISASLRSCATC